MATVTRSGRVVKKPERYVPVEIVEDDDSDVDSHWESDISSAISYDPEDIEDEPDSDDDDFVVDENDVKNNSDNDNNGCDDDPATDGETDSESDDGELS